MTDRFGLTPADWEALRQGVGGGKRRWSPPVDADSPHPHEMATVCEHCGTTFRRKPRGRPPKFCSDMCRDRTRDLRWLWRHGRMDGWPRRHWTNWRSTYVSRRRELRKTEWGRKQLEEEF